MRTILAIAVMLGAVLMLTLLLFNPVPERNVRLLDITMGYFFGLVTMAFSYYFGSSKKNDDEAIQ